ncbi:MAG TPA: ACP phosphodiesterase [Dokdonella sp.]|uniref:acyl carrier protein phosphodiesterase n=1 Tax=Dokdonella sp. TaxID=2291710 RepID=UPI002D80019A|nr:ACP phosphodiesterase [Dokdonella sp.]HET9034338.1 ACP phosphodiesterase [Dokdonella sp.]
MNHLAHALLSGPDKAIQLGGWLGDFVRGRIDSELPIGVQRGIALHRAIDTFTDSHAEIRSLRALFEPAYRRYAGILVDIWFDHLLARDFSRWSEIPLHVFSDASRKLLDDNISMLPDSLHRFGRYMHARNLPAAYADREMISEVLVGVSARFKRENPLAQGLIEISRLEHELAEAFAGFFPQLVGFAAQWRAESSPTEFT